MSPEGVFAVVVNWNGGERNLACLASLVAAGVAEERIVFVDNASADGSLERVAARFPRVRALPQDANLGFGEGANRGARAALEAGAEAVLFANNDLTLAPDALALLCAFLACEPGAGIVGPRVLDARAPGRVWCAGGRMTWRQNLSTLLGHGEPDGPAWRVTRPVDYVAGCALLARRGLLERVGLFEAAYFAYMEDVELCLRAARAGFGVFTVGEAAAFHEPSSATGGGYSPRRKYMQGVNSVHFLREHAGTREWLRFLAFDVATLPALLALGLFDGRARAVLAKGQGILDGLRGRRVDAARIGPGGSWLW